VPDGTEWRLEPGSDLIVQLHLQPTGKPEAVQARVGLFFSDRPPLRTPVGLRLGRETIDIAPGDGRYTVSDAYRLPVDVDVLAIQPHAHNLAREIHASATLPDGTTRTLISIPAWDFRWQEIYRYAEPLPLPKGTILDVRFLYDNSAGNPRNPYSPPRRITWGQNTTNEMGDLWVQVVPRHARDLQALNDDIGRKMRAEDIAAYTKLLQADPDNPLRHDAVAILLLQNGQPGAAIPRLRDSLRLFPDSAPAHYNLGLALTASRELAAAGREFSEAIRLDPNHADAHNALGALAQTTGAIDAAIEHFQRSAALAPDNVEARGNLGHALFLAGRGSEALQHFEQALALQPDWPRALTGLAWIRAASSDTRLLDPREALRLAERALELSARNDPFVLDVLAAAWAAGGQFERAVTVARAASSAADAAGQPALAAQIRDRTALYEQHIAFRVGSLK
jgi:tetratricopeptide (TPR) repeat protein